MCVLRPAAIISRVSMLPALCADRGKRLLLSRDLIGLFTLYNWEGSETRLSVCVSEGERNVEWQPLRCRIMTFIRPALLQHWIL